MRLRTRLFAFSFLQLLALGALFVLTGYLLQQGILPLVEDRIRHQAITVAEHLSTDLEIPLGAQDEAGVREALAAATGEDPDFAGAVVKGADGTVVAQLGAGDGAKPSRPVVESRDVNVEGYRLGTVEVMFSRRRIDDAQRWFLQMAAVAGLALAMGALVSFRFIRAILDPMNRIMEFARHLEEGHLERRIPPDVAVSELKALVGQLNRMADGLEQRDAQLELQRDDLAAAREAALAASKAKSNFLANMSHEIRTPLNGILGVCDLLTDTSMDAVQSDYLRTMRVSADRLLVVINDILDISKIEAGKMAVERVRVELPELVRDVLRLFAGAAADKGLRLRVEAEAFTPRFLQTDPTRLTQVLSNLVSNAIKFTNEGEVAVEIHLDNLSGRAAVRLSVRDEGIGMSAEQLARVFQPFEQGDISTTRRFGGTGLGLAISRNLVNLMGGELRVDSRAGEGSRFDVVLPSTEQGPHVDTLSGHRVVLAGIRSAEARQVGRVLRDLGAEVVEVADAAAVDPLLFSGTDVLLVSARADAGVVRQLAEQPGVPPLAVLRGLGCPPGLEARPELLLPVFGADAVDLVLGQRRVVAAQPALPRAERSLRVLVAEDNRINQMLVTRMLETLGHHVKVVANGRLAVDAVMAGDVDLVLMDIQMPEMDGLEAARAIRRAGQVAVPIIALTANAMQGDAEVCLEAGMNDYLTKPVERAKLAEAVARIGGPPSVDLG